MSWLRSSPLRASFSRQGSRPAEAAQPAKCDPGACYESFCKHWQQAEDIIVRSRESVAPSHDDVLGVVSHLEHLVTLLLLEVRQGGAGGGGGREGLGACLEHLLSENLLDKLHSWGSHTGRYLNAVRLEQLKLYSLLVTHAGQQLLCAEPFLRPLLKLLTSFRTELLPIDLEGRLVCLLGQLCVVLMQNNKFVDLFFFSSEQDEENQPSKECRQELQGLCSFEFGFYFFVPVTLLLSFVHREGPLGQQARAALLLCAALSARNNAVAEYVAFRSNVCPLLATGLSGLYSLLPRKIDVTQPDWHRLTPDDVNDINKLGLFMNSLEFCNAVAQVSNPVIHKQLLDFLYQGFLLPVMGPALLQRKRSKATTSATCLQSGVEEQVAAIAYLELVLRSISEPGLVSMLVSFLISDCYDGTSILHSILPLINGEPRLAIVTISLLETLLDLNCEELMLELVLKYLVSGSQLMVSHRNKTLGCDVHCQASSMFLQLAPDCCTSRALSFPTSSSRKTSVASLDHAPSSLSSVPEQAAANAVSQSISPYGFHANESLYGNYHAYLVEAYRRIMSCNKACSLWSSKYNAFSEGIPSKILTVVNDFQLEHSNLIKEANVIPEANENHEVLSHNPYTVGNKEEDSLPSIGESSGYESFKYRGDDNRHTPEDDTLHEDEYAEDSFWKSGDFIERHSMSNNDSIKAVPDHFKKSKPGQLGDVNIGPLLSITLDKLGKMLENDLFVNLRLTGLLTRLATYPLPILRSFLLCPWIVLQPSITSLYQILVSLKQTIDESVRNEPDCVRLIEEAQVYLIAREIRMTNARKHAIESTRKPGGGRGSVELATHFSQHGVHYHNHTDVGSEAAADQPQWQPQAPARPDQPFRRNEPKRKSLSSTFTSMFSRKVNSGGISHHQSGSSFPIEAEPSSPSTAPYSCYTEDQLWQSSLLRKLLLSAVILDEWLRELAALAQEHVVHSLSEQPATTPPPKHSAQTKTL